MKTVGSLKFSLSNQHQRFFRCKNSQNFGTLSSLLLVCLQKLKPKVTNKINYLLNIGHNVTFTALLSQVCQTLFVQSPVIGACVANV